MQSDINKTNINDENSELDSKINFKDNPEYFSDQILNTMTIQNKPMTITTLSKIINCERRTLGKYLYRLKDVGLLEEKVVGRSSYYSIANPKTNFVNSYDYMKDNQNNPPIKYFSCYKSPDYQPEFFLSNSKDIKDQRVIDIVKIINSYEDNYGIHEEEQIIKEVTAIVDLETTGFYRDVNKWGSQMIDKILQIGITFIDDYLGEILDSFYFNVKEPNFNKSFQNSYVFTDLGLDFDTIYKLNPLYYSLDSYRPFLQSIFNKFKITSYNVWFDLYFLEAKRFNIRYEAPCCMQIGTSTLRKMYKNGIKTSTEDNTFKLIDVYEFLLSKNLSNFHHAGFDSYHTAEIIQELINRGIWKEEIISKITRIA